MQFFERIFYLLISLYELTVAVLKFLPQLFSDLVMVIQLVTDAAAQLPAVFQVFPQLISSMLIACFGVVIIYKVLGREG